MAEISGVLIINKGRGMTSHDVVAKVRKILHTKKVGHTGTLDPDASGVLPVCIGKATKIAQFLLSTDKEYDATLTFGVRTDSQDSTGKIVSEVKKLNFTEEEVRDAFSKFAGEIQQIPPMVSAIRYKGVRLYKLAREGKEIERAPRKIRIFELEITDYQFPNVRFNVACSKGTYIRTLCADIGDTLGCGAHQSRLMRTKSGPFKLSDSITLEELTKMPDPEKKIIPIDIALSHLPSLKVRNWMKELIKKNSLLPTLDTDECFPKLQKGDLLRINSSKGNLLAIAAIETITPTGNTVKILKLFTGN